MPTILESIRNRVAAEWLQAGLMGETIAVTAGPLTVEEAIGKPQQTDFPIQKGKEKLMQAHFRSERGQAFTDHYGTYSGTLQQVADLPLNCNFHRAVFVSTMNAVMRWQQRTSNTIHCKDCGPQECAAELPEFIRRNYGTPRITLIGMQPAMASAVTTAQLPLRIVDLDPDNIGQIRYSVQIEGAETAAEALEWAELLLITGTTLANDTIGELAEQADRKPVLFYGTTIAGAASLMGWQRYCPKSS
ncbi:Rossmann-like domain-containing protein [Oleidesulfovibrio sp.]|uniref:Rossmann-like domain-containing protein n=1 Tax=Oleidesulfovibrio sp. TaxID=2909707 RepID=UPI003A85F7F2